MTGEELIAKYNRHDKPTQVDPPPPPRNHPYVETPLKGKDAKVQLATLLDGPFVNQTACVYVEFADGLCIAEISNGGKNILGVVDRKQVRFWEEAVEVRADGSIVFANAKQPKKEPPPDYSARADVPYTPDLNPPRQVVSEKAPAGGEHSDDSLAAAWNRFVSAGSDTEIPESIPYGISDAVSLLTRHLQDVRGNVPHADLLFAMQELTRRYSDVRFRGVSDEALAQLTTAVVLMIEEAGIPLGKPAVSVKEQKSTLQPDFRGSS